MEKEVVETLRERYTKPHEQTIIAWAVENGLEHVIFYPQGNPTILMMWISPDSQGHFLFREVDVAVESDGSFRISGGATYHEPTYRIAWLHQNHVQLDDLEATLDAVRTGVANMAFDDLIDMDAYLSDYHIAIEL
ncbi:hypothetical protein FJZ36_18905 [Candidatus Poribacteria bacterium]|nr:hypothetical protein [Candidatus Poribacteria bacterium]